MRIQSRMGASSARRRPAMFDNGAGKADGTALDTAKWNTEGTSTNGASAVYQSEAMQFTTGSTAASTDRVTRTFNMGVATDLDVSGTFLHSASGSPFVLVGINCVLSNMDIQNGYVLNLTKGSLFRIQKVTNYNGSAIVSASKTIAASTLYGFRFKIYNGSLMARMWTAGTDEPSDWDVTVTDSTYMSRFASSGISVGPNGTGAQVVTFANITVTRP